MSAVGMIVLPAHTVTPFDPAQVFSEHVGGRKVVYLDNNIWIDLRDELTEPAKRCREACLRAVGDKRAIFPVSWASISELLELPPPALRAKQADVMDGLCGSVTFRNAAVIQRLEAEDVFAHLFFGLARTDRRAEAFTLLPDYTTDGVGRLSFPEGLRPEQVERYVSMWRSREENPAMRVRWMVDHLDHEQALRNHERANGYGPEMDERRAAHREHLGVERVSRSKAAHEERVYMFNTSVLPVIRRELPKLLQRPRETIRRMTELHSNENARIFRRAFRAAAPLMETMTQIFARQAQDVTRTTERQDFWDVEHAALPYAYADAFVTADGGLGEVLRLGEYRPPSARTLVLSSLEDLTTWLDNL
jgi:hypothetical protein